MTIYINIEKLQTLPFSNSNRDDSGQPKSVRVGNTTRGRISSQSLKRSARFYYADLSKLFNIKGDVDGGEYLRTRYVVQLVQEAIKEQGGNEEDLKKAEEIFSLEVLGKKKKDEKKNIGEVLVVLTKEEIFKIAKAVIDKELDESKVNDILANSGKKDIALWGRFFASTKNNNTLEGSAQVAHAFTTHSVQIENDFFVGLDDAASLFSDHAGAGHPGDSFYLNGTFYHYANVSLDETILNLLNGVVIANKLQISDMSYDELKTLTNDVISNFVTSFLLSVPQGKIRSTAHQTLPDFIRVTVREDRPINGAIAFNEAISNYEKNIPLASAKKLISTHQKLERMTSESDLELIVSTFDEIQGTTTSIPELVKTLEEALEPRIQTIYSLYHAED